jgi:hypothetical protein
VNEKFSLHVSLHGVSHTNDPMNEEVKDDNYPLTCGPRVKNVSGIPFGPNQGSLFSWYQVLTAEFFYTFMLSFVVVNTACLRDGNQYFGLAIGA